MKLDLSRKDMGEGEYAYLTLTHEMYHAWQQQNGIIHDTVMTNRQEAEIEYQAWLLANQIEPYVARREEREPHPHDPLVHEAIQEELAKGWIPAVPATKPENEEKP